MSGILEQLLASLTGNNIEQNYEGLPSYPSGMLPKKPETLPFYPQQRYFDEKLAPEQYSVSALEALVKAQKLAQEKELISKQLGQLVLPNMLTEGWKNYGLKSANFDYPVSKERDQRFKKMGFDVNNDSPDVGQTDIYRYPKDPENGYVLDSNLANPITGNQDAQARFAMAMLSEKLARAKGDPEQAIKKWNGKGKAIEKVATMDGDVHYVKADADNHLAKVLKARKLLAHPKNEELMNYYNYLLNENQ
jgi:hypothetical protein